MIGMIKRVLTQYVLFTFLSMFFRYETHAAVFDVTDPYAGPAASSVNGSFAWALLQVNGAASGVGPHTIRFTSAMTLSGSGGNPLEYVLTKDKVTIDAESMTGASCGNPVVLWMGPASQSFLISSNNVVLKGMIINDFRLDVSGAGFIMSNCWFGLDPTGTASMGGGNGYYISLSSTANSANIDGLTCKNVFAGNAGIVNAMVTSSASNITMTNSYFGMDKTGLNRILNFSGSVISIASANGVDLSGCVINGASINKAALELSGTTVHLDVKNNFIGVALNGTYATAAPFWGNEGSGIWQSSGTISVGSFRNNIISINQQFGMLFEGNTNSLLIKACFIGVSGGGIMIAGASYGNGLSGICFSGGIHKGIIVDSNIICQNGFMASTATYQKETCGVVFYISTPASGFLSNNYIGVDANFNKGGNIFSGICFFQCGDMGQNDPYNWMVFGNYVGDNGETPASTDINSSGITLYSSNYILIRDNYIGVGSSGENIGNAANGIELISVDSFIIDNNKISYNKGRRSLSEADAVGGIMIYDSQYGTITGNVISNQNNAGAIYNCQNNGIVIQQGGMIAIGGTLPSVPNTINNNGTHGIHVLDGADFVQITQNIITCNASMGISLNIPGDPGSISSKAIGNNGYGVVYGPTINLIDSGCSAGVTGDAPSGAVVEIFNSPACKTCPNILRGEGETYIGNTAATAGNTYSFTSALSGKVSATATGTLATDCSNGNCRTSRFTDCLIIVLNTIPNQPSIISGNDSSCLNTVETYSVTSVPGVTYIWTVTGGNIISNNGDSITVKWTLSGSDSIAVMPSNVCGNGIPSKVGIQALNLPLVNAGNDTIVNYGDTFQLRGCCGANNQYVWSPSTYLSSSTIASPLISPQNSTVYELQVTDAHHCIAIDTVRIEVMHNIFVPNLITPNKDFQNDFFVIKGICPNTSVQIYNRWGQLVYATSDYHNNWNADGNDDGVYFYRAVESCTKKEFVGWIDVIR